MRSYFWLTYLFISSMLCGQDNTDWVPISNSYGDITNVQFVNSEIGYALIWGDLAKSVDGGNSWIDLNESAYDYRFVSDSEGYAYGRNGDTRELKITLDSGNTWQIIDIPGPTNDVGYPFFISGYYGDGSCFFWFSNTLEPSVSLWHQYRAVYDNRGWVTDAYWCDPWDSNDPCDLPLPIFLTYNIFYGSDGYPYAFANKEIYWFTWDGEPVREATASHEPLMLSISESDINYLFHTQNDDLHYGFGRVGSSDTLGTFTSTYAITKLYRVNNSLIFAIGLYGTIFKSEDDGRNWLLTPSFTNKHIYDIHFVNDTLGYVYCDGSEIYKTTNGGGVLGIIPNNKTIISSFQLIRNYPNPFNPTTTIKYGLPEQSDVNIIIYNIAGQRIKQWSHRQQNPGWYEILWDGTNNNGQKVATGIYLFQMRSKDFVKTRKMVFLK